LFHNQGGGKFKDVTRTAQLIRKDWCTGAAWLDYDRDGNLALFVCRYTDYDLSRDRPCLNDYGQKIYCDPHFYKETHSLLYHNNGNGTFTEVTSTSGIGSSAGRSLGLVSADFNEDGRIDVYVTNDMTPNLLFLNNGNGTFKESATVAGVAFGMTAGKPPAGMGVDYGDYKNSGKPSIVVTNFEKEPISFYSSEGKGTFEYETPASGTEPSGSNYVKWGVRYVDFDLDGFQDVFIVNGHVDDSADTDPEKGDFAQPCQLFRNSNGVFADVSHQSGSFFSRRQVGRAAAFADYDNDGDTDVLVACNNAKPILLRNNTPHEHGWIRVAVEGHGCSRDAFGARVTVRANNLTQTQWVRSGSSYFADHDHRMLFGIGRDQQANIEVRWPCGAVQTSTIRKGESTVIKEALCKSRRTD
jgi:hypothetical protein